ncbi:glycosyltransferase [Lentisphaerota bacterium WC36G]|nr:glycosyltransferase [Lentisphaerae bacterium WC36]
MKRTPKHTISVAMAVCNGENFIAEQLFSILEQTHAVDEIIICDDSKDDKTYDVLKNIVQQHPKVIKYFHNTEVLGASKNFAKAISLTTKDFIMLADQDDLWLANKVELLYSLLKNNYNVEHKICGAFCNSTLVDSNLSPFKPSVNHLSLRGFSPKDIINGEISHQQQFDLFLKRVPIAGHNMIFSKEAKEILFPFPNLKQCHDSWIGYNIAALGKWYFCNEELTLFRQHSKNVSQANRRNQLQEAIYSLKNNTFKWNKKLFIELVKRLENKIDQSFIEELYDRSEHSEQRALMLKKNCFSRTLIVYKELKNKRYFKYSRGWKSAFQDLVLNSFVKH